MVWKKQEKHHNFQRDNIFYINNKNLKSIKTYKIKYTKGTLNAAFTGDSVDGLSGSTNYSDYANSNINATGGGQAHNNMMPYITCYIWKRVA